MLVQALDRFKISCLHIATSLLDLSPLHVYHCTLLLIPLQTGAFHSILCDCHDSFQLVLRSSKQLHVVHVYRDRGGGGAGRAIALPLFCWDLFSRAPVDLEKVIVELLDFSLKGGRLEPVVFDESLRTMQFLWKSGMFACPNDYNPMCVQG